MRPALAEVFVVSPPPREGFVERYAPGGAVSHGPWPPRGSVPMNGPTGGFVERANVGTWFRRIALENGPLLAVAATAVLAASTFWPNALGLAFAYASGFALLTVVACGSLFLVRGGRAVAALCLMVTPLGSGCMGCLGTNGSWGIFRYAEGGVVAAIVAIAVALPTAIAFARTRGAPEDSALRMARARGAWLVAGLSLALAASVLWKPPEYVAEYGFSVEPTFDVLLWTPRAAWADEVQLSARVAEGVLCAGVLAVLVVAGLDLRDVRRARAHRAALPGPTPYRTAPNVPHDEGFSVRPHASLRGALLCLGVSIGAAVYLVARVDHFVANTELLVRTDAHGRELAVPSPEGACRAVQRGDTQDLVAARFRDTRANVDWIGQPLQRWRSSEPGAPTCAVRYRHTYDSRGMVVESVDFAQD